VSAWPSRRAWPLVGLRTAAATLWRRSAPGSASPARRLSSDAARL